MFQRRRYRNRKWDLMGTEGSFNGFLINRLWACPSLWGSENYHWPDRPRATRMFLRVIFDLFDPVDSVIERSCHAPVHIGRVRTFDKDRQISIALKKSLQLFVGYARQHGRVRDFISV